MMMNMIVGNEYNWKNQPERLYYMGKKGSWHQFCLTQRPMVVWCEVLTEDLCLLEETKDTN